MIGIEDLPSLALFAHVVESQSFAETGRRMGLAKSAVSQRVARLERRLGVQLLRRSTRKLSLTEEGLRLYEHAATLLRVTETATRAVSAASAAIQGRVRLNAPASFRRELLCDALQSFLSAHPGVTLQLTVEDRLVDLVESGYDIIIRMAVVGEQTFIARRLARDRVVVVGAPSYLARMGRPTQPEELLHHNCLRYTLLDRRNEWRFGRPGARYSIPVVSNFETNDDVALREAALAGVGLLITPSLTVAELVRSGRLETVLDGWVEEEIGVFAITTARRVTPPAVKALVEHLGRYFAERPLGLPAPSAVQPGGASPSRRAVDSYGTQPARKHTRRLT
ncbi:LysR family transcriptional regulator [Archangium minus]|uniref:LysR family transcriptional regulator n=1 Tax=Archangium minus TaxID=83450 RepID=A0ABY9X6J3_9BACT|nr:LysR family transcriptional regulator [Archangium minus]